ncbi:MAG: tRNA-dihydrouridine synthase family protein, partial [Pseudobutyrivibrio sp.]|nr:tRNA-dihydrouridine synthase family protein [Pseudobutyrivibrio sp.]
MNIYLAPLEGITDNIYRNTFYRLYGGVTRMYTPFLSPNSTEKFPAREWDNIDPAINDSDIIVPQLLTCNSQHFLWAAKEICGLGFKEINLNLGCPSGTVVAKKKGSGLLYYPWELDIFLQEIFEGAYNLGQNISIKTRIGKNSCEEWPEILDIFKKYPVSELIIHPRLTCDFYKGPLHMECFDAAYSQCKYPVVYNGDIKSLADIDKISASYPDCSALMIGRGLIENPAMLSDASTTLKEFHDELVIQYQKRLSGEMPLLHRMKEM